MRVSSTWLWAILGFSSLLAVWYIVSNAFSAFLIPPPHQVGQVLISLLQDKSYYLDIGYTLYKTLVSFVIAAAVGVPVGLLVGYSTRAYFSIQPIIDFFRSVPAVALFPIFLLLFGLNDQARILIAVFSGVMIIILNSMYGVQNSNKARVLAATTMRATQFQIFKFVILFDALPYVFVGFRQSISIILVIVLVTEMFFGGINGLGYRITNYYDLYNISEMFATVILVGIIGFLLNILFYKIEKKIVHWSGR
jgi:ABC-type nitrate/sulfonate/bicarbonate transport system permease component